MMILYLFVLLMAFSYSAETFQPGAKGRSRASAALVGSGGIRPVKGTHQPLFAVTKDFRQKWAELEKRQREYERGSHSKAEAYSLAKEMLELALITVNVAEEDEYEHAVQAHKRFEKAIDQEHALEEAARHAHEEAQEAFDQIKSFDRRYLSNLDEFEQHRQLANFDVAHRVEEYAKSRLNEARAVEEDAKQEEEEADLHLLELMDKEAELKAFLDQLRQSAGDAEKFQQEPRHPVLDVE